ncbi:hypothetical protein CRUP_012315 [Coryphaenoides rupestris]|nr:hypothetical protein CRUP_012315 [Coryphaenoides rupestris]
MRLRVRNGGPAAVCFTYYTLLHWIQCFRLDDERKGTDYETPTVVYPQHLGELAPVAPYRLQAISARHAPDLCRVVDGQPPDSQSVMHLKTEMELKKYNVPPYMRRLTDALREPDRPMDPSTAKLKAVLDSNLTTENYTERLQLLLYLEEMQMLVDIKRYNIPSSDGKHATMRKHQHNKKLLVLEVPGVAENRPSVLRGDRIIVRPRQGGNVKLLHVFVDNMEFSVEFTVGRLPVRLQHRAAELATQQSLGVVLLFDRQLEQNQEQYKAVQHIVAGSSKPAPYLVFGPPGTGKTVTLVEAIKQIQRSQPASCHILACAPSNSAADLLCKKIVEHVDKRLIYRMYASSFDYKRVPAELKVCCNLVGTVYTYPSKEELMQYSILVTTLCTAGRLVSGGIKPGHFSHVFVDEAGHAVETDRKGRAKLAPKDIGIIAPYRKQVLKIRKGLRIVEKELGIDLDYLKVGSVEEFQGQERTVVLVSTVRSDPKYTDLDQKFTLGFVKNEKRFNVAVTRAKALLVVVGNPRVLCTDPVWRCFIQYCKHSGGYTGFSYDEEEEYVVARLAALWVSIEPQAEKEAETEESVLQQLLDPEWRKELAIIRSCGYPLGRGRGLVGPRCSDLRHRRDVGNTGTRLWFKLNGSGANTASLNTAGR